MAWGATCAAFVSPDEALAGVVGAELRYEVAVVQRLAPGLPIALPHGKPNTRPAIEQAVRVLRQDRSRGMDCIRRIYRAFWCDGQDISAAVILNQLMGDCSADGADEQSHRIAQEWEAAWRATGQAGVPLVVSPGGDLLVGCVPEEDIRRFFV